MEFLAERPIGTREPDVPHVRQGSSLLDRLSVLMRRRKTVFLFAVAGGSMGIALALSLRDQFESSAELMPPDQSGSSFLAAALASRGGEMAGSALPSLLGIKTSGALFLGILQSRSAQEDMIAKFGLQSRYGAKTLERTRRMLLERSQFLEDRKSGIITIRVRDQDRGVAKQMCQEYIDLLDRRTAQLSTSAARREREFLERRLAVAGDELSRSEQDFSRFAHDNKAIDIPEETKQTVVAAASLEGQLAAAEAQLNGMEQIYAPGNSRVRATEGRVAVLRSKLQQLGGSAARPGVYGGDEMMTPAFEQLPKLGIAYADLFRKVKIQETVYSALTSEFELARVQEAKEIPTVRVLDPPSLPEIKVAPHRSLMVAGLTFLAFLSGCGWVLAYEAWGNLDPDDEKKSMIRFIATEVKSDFRKLRIPSKSRSA